MDSETAEALEASIKHWKQNAAAELPTQASTSGADCALCRRFIEATCAGCPVKLKTNSIRCLGTPYYDVKWWLSSWLLHPSYGDLRDDFRAAALEEVAFLESLREPT